MNIEIEHKGEINKITINLCKIDAKTQHKVIAQAEQALKAFVTQHPNFFPAYEEVVSTEDETSSSKTINKIRHVRKEGIFRGDTILDPETKRITGYQLILVREQASFPQKNASKDQKELEEVIHQLRLVA